VLAWCSLSERAAVCCNLAVSGGFAQGDELDEGLSSHSALRRRAVQRRMSTRSAPSNSTQKALLILVALLVVPQPDGHSQPHTGATMHL